ncbi:hypothetical protein [Pseudomonas faucium]|uniref:hypothetical protein n=1 Tax=Pseudomonas faucium TaxID=2740518 RepID=UPI0039C471BC
MTTAHLIFLSIYLLDIVFTFITLGLTAYYAHREIDKIENLLISSKMVVSNKIIFSHAGLIGKIFRITSLSFLLMRPTLFARKGLIDPNDIAQLSKKTQTQLKTIGYAYTILIITLFASSALSYLLPPLPE